MAVFFCLQFCGVNRYKVEGELKASPEAVFSYIDPSPNSSRSQWDKAIKELQLIEKVSEVPKF
jgi:hypothetical protein